MGLNKLHSIRLRSFDCLFALIGILVFTPFMAVIVPILLIANKGTVFFFQKRVGFDRRLFHVIKLCTIKNGNKTGIGCWLRRTGLDEVPQFINVLLGSMSMVGPRPLMQEDIDRLGWSDDRYNFRWSMPPGITGLAQIYAGQSARISLMLDKKYVQSPTVCRYLFCIGIAFMMNVFGKLRIRRFLRNH